MAPEYCLKYTDTEQNPVIQDSYIMVKKFTCHHYLS
jgi:hypothetical protein